MKDANYLVVTIAMDWEAARREVIRLKATRNAHACQHERDDNPEAGLERVEPCWKRHDWDYEGEAFPQDLWCAPCLKRQTIHKQVELATRKRAVLLRRLQVYAHRLRQELVSA